MITFLAHAVYAMLSIFTEPTHQEVHSK